MTFDPRYLSAFQEAVATASRASANLAYTLGRVAPLLPLDPLTLATLSQEERERFDALAGRFARCQQMAGVAFKALSLLEAEPQGRFIDLLALMQKRGLIVSIEAWDGQRDLRNDAGHVYLATEADFARFHNAVAEASPAVIAYADGLVRYALSLGIPLRSRP